VNADDNGGPGSTPTRREQTAPGSTSVPESDTGHGQPPQARGGLAQLVAASIRRREELEARLRADHQAALTNGDHTTAAQLARRLDRAYVGRAHRRAADPVVRRYRRLVASA
jgi:hypothetical protein